MTDYRPVSLRAMAEKLGVSPAFLSDVEKGKRGCSIELFRKMKESGYNNKFLSAFQITTVKRAGSKKTEITDPVTRVTFEMETYFLDSKNIVKGNF